MAARCGDPGAAARQRTADNPFARVDWIGSVLLPLFLLWRGMPVLGWTRLTPLETNSLRRPCRDGLLIAAAGPAANLLLALAGIGVFLSLKAAGIQISPFPTKTLFFFCQANAELGAFNLLPIPPLSGSVAAGLCLRGDALTSFEEIKPFGFLLILAGIYLNIFDFITLPLTRMLMGVLG
jgi:Zn-dependent protease